MMTAEQIEALAILITSVIDYLKKADSNAPGEKLGLRLEIVSALVRVNRAGAFNDEGLDWCTPSLKLCCWRSPTQSSARSRLGAARRSSVGTRGVRSWAVQSLRGPATHAPEAR